MRTTRKNNAVLGLLLGAVLMALPMRGFAATAPQASIEGGVTVTPATLTLRLHKGVSGAQAKFTIANSYSAGIALHFAFEQSVKTPGSDKSAINNLQITPTDVTITAKTTVTEVISLVDSKNLAPGSQQLDLVLTQQALPGANISVVPSIHMPLIVVKEDGAVTSFLATTEGTPSFSLNMPNSITVRMKNTGNMVAVPRGFVSITDPGGREVSKGVLNTGSLAVAPGNELKLPTPMVLVDHPWPPGPYHVHVSYGIGGGQAAQVSAVQLFYIPVWQMLLALVLVGMTICIRQIWMEWANVRLRATKPPHKGTPASGANV